MRYQTQERQRVGVAEGRQRSASHHVASDGFLGVVGQFAVLHHHALAVFRELAVDMHTRASLTHGNLRSEGQGDTVFVSQLAHNPLGDHELVGGILDVGGQELNFVLLVNLAVVGEVTYFGVTVLNQAAGLGDEAHGLDAVLGELVERGALVVALLVGHLVNLFVVGDDVILQLAHGLHAEARGLLEHFVRLVQDVFR